MALSPTTGTPHISYYDNTKGDLKLAFPTTASGDCGPSQNWSCNTIAFQNTTDYGLQSALDFTESGTWGIAYINSTANQPEFRGIPSPGAQEIFWNPIELAGAAISVLPSLRYGQSNVAHVSYGLIDLNQGKGYIKYAKAVGLGGNCGGGQWQCDNVVQVSTIGAAMYNTL